MVKQYLSIDRFSGFAYIAIQYSVPVNNPSTQLTSEPTRIKPPTKSISSLSTRYSHSSVFKMGVIPSGRYIVQTVQGPGDLMVSRDSIEDKSPLPKRIVALPPGIEGQNVCT
jgi:hypothetical protein